MDNNMDDNINVRPRPRPPMSSSSSPLFLFLVLVLVRPRPSSSGGLKRSFLFFLKTSHTLFNIGIIASLLYSTSVHVQTEENQSLN